MMIPNNQADADTRFRRLVEAVKFVYASTYFSDGRVYRLATGRGIHDDRMAVIVQEVVGRRHGDRFYPNVSGVARSFSFYRSARARPEDGVVALALGLGRTIVDEGMAWTYAPPFPAAPPPVTSLEELADVTQAAFWAVHMGRPPAYDPVRETEYLVRAGLAAAEDDGTLRWVASTYDASGDRLVPGLRPGGARVINFAPLLGGSAFPVNDAIRTLLRASEDATGDPVEIEFALTIDEAADVTRLGLLQVRPMVLVADQVRVEVEDLHAPEAVVASDSVMGNGTVRDIRDVVYVQPDNFDPRRTSDIAVQVGQLNAALRAEGARYVLIGCGRWGTSTASLGIPVAWPQISGACAIVETTLPGFAVELSQGSHFFHNISSAGVSYFSIPSGRDRIDWDWLRAQPVVRGTDLVRHVRTETPLVVDVDGRSGRGVIRRAAAYH
jgi:hypothetical protein